MVPVEPWSPTRMPLRSSVSVSPPASLMATYMTVRFAGALCERAAVGGGARGAHRLASDLRVERWVRLIDLGEVGASLVVVARGGAVTLPGEGAPLAEAQDPEPEAIGLLVDRAPRTGDGYLVGAGVGR